MDDDRSQYLEPSVDPQQYEHDDAPDDDLEGNRRKVEPLRRRPADRAPQVHEDCTAGGGCRAQGSARPVVALVLLALVVLRGRRRR